MSANRLKLIVFTCLVLSPLLCLAACVGTIAISSIAGNGEKLPVRSLEIEIVESQRDKLFIQLQKFADKHAFGFQLSFYEPDKKSLLITMLRNDIEISANAVSSDPTAVFIGFYNKYPMYSAYPKTIDDLIIDLKTFLAEIPNMRIVEEK